jgi:Tol biopolymer transport system component
MIWRIAAIVFAVLLIAGAFPVIRHFREVQPPAPPPSRFAFVAPPDAQLGAGDDVLDAAISPDGGEIVFVATSSGTAQLWHRRLDTDRAERVPGTAGAAMPAWKRTGRVIAFFADGKLKQIALANGAVRELAGAPRPAGVAWLPDGSLLFVPDARGPVKRLRSSGPTNADGPSNASGPTRVGPDQTDATVLKAGDRGHAFPSSGADGRFVYTAMLDSGRRLVRLAVDGGDRDLAMTSADAQLVDDQVVFLRDNTLVTQPLDRDTMSLAGRARPLAFDVGTSSAGRGFFAASPRVVVWANAGSTARDLTWFDLSSEARGAKEDRRNGGTIGEPADYWQVRLSPDDRDAALTMLDPLLRTLDIFVMPLSGAAVPQKLTRALAADSDPVWSPRGDRVLFRSLQGGRPDLFSRPVRAVASKDELMLRSDLDETPTDWSARGILFHAPINGALDILSLDPVRGTQTPITRSGFNEFDARWSPDGRSIAYASDESGQPDIYVEPTPVNQSPVPQTMSGLRTRVTFAGGTHPQWSRDGRSLFFLRDGRLMRADVVGGKFSTPRVAFQAGNVRDYSLAHNSDRVLVIVPAPRSETPVAGAILNWMP